MSNKITHWEIDKWSSEAIFYKEDGTTYKEPLSALCDQFMYDHNEEVGK